MRRENSHIKYANTSALPLETKLTKTVSIRAGLETSSPRFPKGERYVDDSRRAQYRSFDPSHLGDLQNPEVKIGLGR